MPRPTRNLLLVAACSALFAATAASATTIGLAGPAGPVAVGESVAVSVVLSGHGVLAIGAYDLDIAYPNATLQFTGVLFLGVLGDPNALPNPEVAQSASAGGGVIDLAESSVLSAVALGALQGDPLVLAVISFIALAPGTAALSIVDDPAFLVVDGAAGIVAIDRPLGSLTITVPEPGVIVLLGVAGAWARQKRRSE